MCGADILEEAQYGFQISEITPTEVPELAALWDRYDSFRGLRGTLDYIELNWRSPSSTILLARQDGALVASAIVGYDGHLGWIYGICVDLPARKKGHGKSTIAAAENWLRDRGASAVTLQVRFTNLAVQGFYNKLGYSFQNCVLLGKIL
jgi:ribosomal protein S18 acetylase RimI-like enzyme